MSRRSSVRGNVLHVKTVMGLGRFEVGKTCNSYDVPFRSYSIEFEKNRSFELRHPFKMGAGAPPKVSTPFLMIVKKKVK